MAREKVKQVQVFSLPTEYERQTAEARRREMMAEMLAQQAYDPGQYQGAPIPKAAPVVKALEGYLRGREMRKAREAGEAAEKAGRTEFADYIRSFEPERRTVSTADVAAMEMPTPSIDASGRVAYTPASAIAAPNQQVSGSSMTDPLQMQVGGPLSMAQRRARALEGFESTNPMVQQFAATQYEKTMPRELDLKLGAINPAEVDMASVAEAQRTGDISRIKPREKSAEAPSPTQLARLIAERDALPQNDPKRSMYDAAIKGETQGRGTTVNLPPSPRDLRKDEGGLRDELKGRLKEMDWEGVRSAYQRIFTAPENAVGDVAIVYAVAKADDPTGAVRKEDFDLRAKDGSLGGRIKALYEEAKSGRMLPDRRQQLIDTAYELYTARQNDVNSLLGQYQEIATRSGLDVQNVVNPFKAKPLERRIVWTPEKQKELDELNRKRQAQGR
jgi:hypothetical protein